MLVYDHLTPVYRGKTGKGGVQGEGGGGQAFSLFLRIGGMFTYICLDSYYLLLSTRIINTFSNTLFFFFLHFSNFFYSICLTSQQQVLQ